MIAYSSISHMGIVALSCFMPSQIGLVGATIMMVSHGLISCSLFSLCGSLYERHRSRLVRYYHGLSQYVPRWSTLLITFLLANCGLPGTSAFLGELTLLLSVATKTVNVAATALLASVLLSAGLSM